jgi:Grx4 family monothiol glutaredoxin
MRSILETLASTYAPTTPPSISFLSLNAEELPEISESYDVTAVPFLVLQREGKVLESISGCDATKVRAAVERFVGKDSRKVALPEKLVATPRPQTEAPQGANGAAAQEPASDHAGAKEEAKEDTEVLNKRLEGLVKAASVMLFMKGTPSAPQCGFSRQLVSLLREQGVRYGFFNILADDEVRQGLKVWAEWPTFPQLWVGGELVGGLDIVRSSFSSLWTHFLDDMN